MGLRTVADERAVEALRLLLGDSDLLVREEAAKTLGEIGPAARSCVSELNGLLNDEYACVRSAAAEALKKIGGEEKK